MYTAYMHGDLYNAIWAWPAARGEPRGVLKPPDEPENKFYIGALSQSF